MYRVDVFHNGGHNIKIFKAEEKAREYANNQEGHVFLLKEIGAGIFEKPMFDVIEEVKEA